MSKELNLTRSRLSLSTFYFTMGLVFASWASRIPDIQAALSLSDGQLGTILFAIPCGQLAMMAISGYLVNRHGSRAALTISCGMYSIVLVMISLATNFYTLFATLFFFGVAANMYNISLNTQACALENLYGRNIMSTFHGTWSLGSLFGGLVGVAFVSTGLSLSVHYATVAIAGIIAGATASRRLITRDQLPQAYNEKKGGLSLHHIDIAVILLGITCFCGMFCEGTLFDWSSVYFASVVRPDENLVRLGYVFGIGAMTLGRFTADRFTTRYSPRAVLRFCGLSITAGLWLATAMPSCRQPSDSCLWDSASRPLSLSVTALPGGSRQCRRASQSPSSRQSASLASFSGRRSSGQYPTPPTCASLWQSPHCSAL